MSLWSLSLVSRLITPQPEWWQTRRWPRRTQTERALRHCHMVMHFARLDQREGAEIIVTKLKRQTLPPPPPQRNKQHARMSKCRVNPGCPSLLWHVSVYMLLSIFFIIAGWKLSPMVGGIYSPELYTGKKAFLYSYLTDTQQTLLACLPKLITIRGQAKLFWFLQSAKHGSDYLFIYLFLTMTANLASTLLCECHLNI